MHAASESASLARVMDGDHWPWRGGFVSPEPLFEAASANLLLWRRARRSGFRPLFRWLVQSGWGHGTVEGIKPAIGELVPRAPAALHGLRRELERDIAKLVGLFRRHSGAVAIRIKLDIERTDRCRFFHTDNVGLRLLCTYDGPATEWVPDDAVLRHRLGGGGNDGVLLDPTAVERLHPWWVGLFKGDAYPGFFGQGCVHRSPPIERRRVTRILLTIDSPHNSGMEA